MQHGMSVRFTVIVFARETPCCAKMVLMEPESKTPPPLNHRRAVVVPLLFCVLGPLGLRLLWNSPEFKFMEKVVLSVLSVLEFLLVGYLLSRWYVTYLLSIGADGPT